MGLSALLCIALAPRLLPDQEPVTVHIDAAGKVGPLKPIFSRFGYDEPNYTYMKYGPKPGG